MNYLRSIENNNPVLKTTLTQNCIYSDQIEKIEGFINKLINNTKFGHMLPVNPETCCHPIRSNVAG